MRKALLGFLVAVFLFVSCGTQVDQTQNKGMTIYASEYVHDTRVTYFRIKDIQSPVGSHMYCVMAEYPNNTNIAISCK